MGDIVRTSYILPGLKDKYREASIHWVVKYPGNEILINNQFIDAIIEIESAHMLDNFYDLVISLDDEFKSASLTKEINYSRIIGTYLKEKKVVYTEDSSLWFDMGLISRFGKSRADKLKKNNTLSHNKIFEKILQIKINSPLLESNHQYAKLCENDYDSSIFNIGINPCAGLRWPSKELSLYEFKNLVNLLLSANNNIFNHENTLINVYGIRARDEYCTALESFGTKVVIRDTSESIQLFAAHIKRCDYFISSDSLALHLAISQRIPSCSFFSPTSASEIGTFGTGVKLVSLAGDYCSYNPNADNSSISAERIFTLMQNHLKKLRL